MNKNVQRLLLVVLAAVILAIAITPLWDYLAYRQATGIYNGYVARISGVVPVNKYLLDAVATLCAAIQLFAWGLIARSYVPRFRQAGQKRRHTLGFAILTCLAVGEKLSLYALTQNSHINPKTGESTAYFCITRSGIDWMPEPGYCENGVPNQRLTPAESDRIELLAKRKLAKLCPQHDAFFNAYTGQPEVWYARDANGICEFYNLPGANPSTGEPLQPVGRTIEDECRASLDSCRGVAPPAPVPKVAPTPVTETPPPITETPTVPTATGATEVLPPPVRPPQPRGVELRGLDVALQGCREAPGSIRCALSVRNRTSSSRSVRLGTIHRPAAQLVGGRGLLVATRAELAGTWVSLARGPRGLPVVSCRIPASGRLDGFLDFQGSPPGFTFEKLLLTVDLGDSQVNLTFPTTSAPGAS